MVEKNAKKKHIFIVGAKSIGQYGGYETFLNKLTEQHKNNSNIQYYISAKANGIGHMDETKLEGVVRIDDQSFLYNNAFVTKIEVPQIGAAQAILYDIKSLDYWIKYCEKNEIKSPVFYILACRIGFALKNFAKRIHKLDGVVYVNPDGDRQILATKNSGHILTNTLNWMYYSTRSSDCTCAA